MTETEKTTTATFAVAPATLCPCGMRTFALDGLCDLCSEEAEVALAIMLSTFTDDWTKEGDTDGGDPRVWDDTPF